MTTQLSLANLKINKRASRETLAFSADIMLGEDILASAVSAGKGGAILFAWYGDTSRARGVAAARASKFVADYVRDYGKGTVEEQGEMTVLELTVFGLAEEADALAWAKKRAKFALCFTTKNRLFEMSFVATPPTDEEVLLRAEAARKKYGEVTFLNHQSVLGGSR